MEVVAVDWSGAASGASRHIWLAHVVKGELVTLRNGRSRVEVVDDLVALAERCPDGLAVGLDFSFSFPAWFLHAQGCATVGDLWEMVGRDGERWLSECAPPFWGRPGCPRPQLAEHHRQAERQISVGGISPKSVFQVGGAGAVGTGSIRGMPLLPVLRSAGFSVWPFDPPSPWTVMEIYPRLLTGPVRKSSREQRDLYLGDSPWSVRPAFARSISHSDDAFDAAISALMMDAHADDLAVLRQSTDPVTCLEGDVWCPPKIGP
jgi:hypothetical protein